MAALLLYNSAQVLACLALAGLALCLWRLPRSEHPGHLTAFAFMLAGAFLREVVVFHYGPIGWPDPALMMSAFARVLKIIGALLFVRAVTHPRCGEWAWIACGLVALCFAAVTP